MFIVLAVAGSISVNAQAGPDDVQKALVVDLVEATYSAFPSDFFRKAAVEGARSGIADLSKAIEERMISGINADQEITEAERSEAKAKAPAFAVRLAEKALEIGLSGLDIDSWVKEALAFNYFKNLTTPEMKELKAFLSSESGQTFLAVIREEAAAAIEKRPSQSESIIAKADAEEVTEFIASAVGKKFLAAFENDTTGYLKQKSEEFGSGVEERIISSIKDGELARMVKEFKASIVKPKQ